MRALGLVVAVLWLTSCATAHDAFTNPTGVIPVPRQDFIDTYATVRELYVTLYVHLEASCRQGQLGQAKCARIAQIHEEAKALDFAIRAKIAVPETTLDWAAIGQVVQFAVKLVL